MVYISVGPIEDGYAAPDTGVDGAMSLCNAMRFGWLYMYPHIMVVFLFGQIDQTAFFRLRFELDRRAGQQKNV